MLLGSVAKVVLNRQCCRPCTIVVADEVPYGTDMVSQFLGKRAGCTHETRHMLPQGIVMAIFLEASRSTGGARLADEHDGCSRTKDERGWSLPSLCAG
jgi:hypothetical protein